MANPYSPYDFTPEPPQGAPAPVEGLSSLSSAGAPGLDYRQTPFIPASRLRALGWTNAQITDYFDWLQANPDMRHGILPPGAGRGLPPGQVRQPGVGGGVGVEPPNQPAPPWARTGTQGGGSTFNALMGAAQEME